MKTKFRYKSELNVTWSYGCVNVPKELFGKQVIDYLINDLTQLGIKVKYVEIEK